MKNVSKSLLAVLAFSSVSAFAVEKQSQEPVSQTPVVEEQAPAEEGAVQEQAPVEEQVPHADLPFEGARWGGKAAGYVCEAAVATFVAAPVEYTDLNVAWGTVVTDFTLDNGLLLATFQPDEETTCRYSAIMFANDTQKTIKLIESRAYPSVGEGSCAAGKAILDEKLALNKYLWKESRKHLTILAPSVSAEEICGKGVANVGIDFVFTGKIN